MLKCHREQIIRPVRAPDRSARIHSTCSRIQAAHRTEGCESVPQLHEPFQLLCPNPWATGLSRHAGCSSGYRKSVAVASVVVDGMPPEHKQRAAGSYLHLSANEGDPFCNRSAPLGEADPRVLYLDPRLDPTRYRSSVRAAG